MPLSHRKIFSFWVPLAATWVMMSAEGPFLSAVIARLADPEFNLGAWGVAFAFAILVEAPVIMLMSAATALVEDAVSYRRFRAFANWLNAGSTVLLVVVLLPPVYEFLAGPLLGLPGPVADLSHRALWFFLPWPAAIGYRRFVQGVLIRSGRTRLVAYGTVLRVIAMASTAGALAVWSDLPGAAVGAGALAVAVCVEAAAARWMARGTIAELLDGAEGGPSARGPDPEEASEPGAPPGAGPVETGPGAPARDPAPEVGEDLDYRAIARFYFPLALTSLLALVVHPLLTFFMGRAPSPVESLAVFPVVGALSFVFRSLGLAYQDAAIALLGEGGRHFPELGRFAAWLGAATSLVLGAVVFVEPLADFWFITVSGLEPALAEFALTPARILVPLPALTVAFSLQRAVLMKGRTTRPITVATAVEVAVVALTFPVLGWGLGMVGATAAFAAFLAGRTASNLYLVPRCRRVLRGGAG